MRVRGRRSLLGAALAAALLVSAACSSSGGSANHGALSPKSKTGGETLKLYNDKGAWSDYFKQVGALAKQQIGSNLDPVGYTDENTYQAFIKASLRTKVKPDLFTWATGGQLKSLVDQGAVADTSKVWQDAIDKGYLTRQLEPYYTINGKQYCVPLNVAYWGMFYNKHVFDQYGLQPPKTWDDFQNILTTLRSHNVTPMYQTSTLFSFVWFEQLLAGSDPDTYNALATGKAKYTDKPVVDAMKMWAQEEKDGDFTDPSVKTQPQALLKSGAVAMVPFGTWFNTSMTGEGEKPGTDYGFFVIPNVNPSLAKTSMVFETGPLCALSSAPHLQDSISALSWWLTPDAQSKWAGSRDDVSANPKAPITDSTLAEVTKAAGSGQYNLINRYFEAAPPPVLTAALDAFSAFMVHPDSYMDQLNTIQKAADQYWASAN
ncbi:MAG TPA: extracellular solute-binding protein [Jatrophihabitantaceae bacterium]|jgi:multiple sugar transport system substrate-binding protein|nr:extracellular solute-binding protein [Jatrophihabitantaceae bacterium]